MEKEFRRSFWCKKIKKSVGYHLPIPNDCLIIRSAITQFFLETCSNVEDNLDRPAEKQKHSEARDDGIAVASAGPCISYACHSRQKTMPALINCCCRHSMLSAINLIFSAWKTTTLCINDLYMVEQTKNAYWKLFCKQLATNRLGEYFTCIILVQLTN